MPFQMHAAYYQHPQSLPQLLGPCAPSPFSSGGFGYYSSSYQSPFQPEYPMVEQRWGIGQANRPILNESRSSSEVKVACEEPLTLEASERPTESRPVKESAPAALGLDHCNLCRKPVDGPREGHVSQV